MAILRSISGLAFHILVQTQRLRKDIKEIERTDTDIDREIERTDTDIDTEIERTDTEIERKDTEIERTDTEIERTDKRQHSKVISHTIHRNIKGWCGLWTE